MAFGNLKQILFVGQWVRIGNTCSELDGMLGRIAGTQRETAQCDFYIVLLSKKLSYKDDVAIVLVESCLEAADGPVSGQLDTVRASALGSDSQWSSFPSLSTA